MIVQNLTIQWPGQSNSHAKISLNSRPLWFRNWGTENVSIKVALLALGSSLSFLFFHLCRYCQKALRLKENRVTLTCVLSGTRLENILCLMHQWADAIWKMQCFYFNPLNTTQTFVFLCSSSVKSRSREMLSTNCVIHTILHTYPFSKEILQKNSSICSDFWTQSKRNILAST